MTTIQGAAVLLRVFSLYLFLDVTVILTELPAHIYGIFNSPSSYTSSQRELALGMALVRLLFYAGTGIAFLAFTRPLAKLLSKGLESCKS